MKKFAILFGLLLSLLAIFLADRLFAYMQLHGIRLFKSGVAETKREDKEWNTQTLERDLDLSFIKNNADPYKEIREKIAHGADYTMDLSFTREARPHHNVRDLNIHVTTKIKENNQLLYQYRSDYDAYGKRRSYHQKKNAKHYAALFGCSIVYGVGLESDKTIPSFLNQKENDINFYNLGFSGYGPNDIYEMVKGQNFNKLSDIKEKDGIVIFNFFEGHAFRALCGLRCFHPYGEWILEKSSYTTDANGHLIFRGKFKDLFPYSVAFLHKILQKSGIVAYFDLLNFPLFSERQKDTLVELYRQSLMLIHQKLHFSRAYIYIYPGTEKEMIPIMKPIFEKAGFIILDYSQVDLSALTGNRDSIPLDGHPTAESDWVLSEIIARDIKRGQIKF